VGSGQESVAGRAGGYSGRLSPRDAFAQRAERMARAEIEVWCAAKLVGLGACLVRLSERDGYELRARLRLHTSTYA
jgi:hypothetical protein